jgi:hypothetical protein
MIEAFDRLSDQEVEIMFRSPMLVCILIAGADGTVDRKEMSKAISVAEKKTTRSKASLLEFYRYVNEDFEDKLKIVLQGLPVDAEERNRLIVAELSTINNIFPKVDKSFAADFHWSLKFMAAKIAESSGGLLGIRKVGEEEERFVDLPMIKAPA